MDLQQRETLGPDLHAGSSKHVVLVMLRRCAGACSQVCWDFTVKEAVRSLFASPEFCAARGTERDTSAAGVYGCKEAQRLDEETEGALSRPENSLILMGGDWGQPFTFTSHSTGALFMR